MKTNILPAILLTLLMAVFFCGIYTAAIYGISQWAPNHGKGEVILFDGKTYYKNIGQKFSDNKYFWSRPSAVGYNAAGSGGSNKGPSNPDYLTEVKARIDSILAHNPGLNPDEIPSDIVTASGSGLDPHISVQAANFQVKRIADVRGLPEEKIKQLILSNTESPVFGLFGTAKINVLQLNLELDHLK
ncbi:MAG: K(+)-transporting ATPase subunit C [Saprospiraceae bacterium]|nr:K(+)-transporting ATPase subunit C [Saprospiraceae bacterium]